MEKLKRACVPLSLALCLCLGHAFACTGLCLQYKEHSFVGKNHDWVNKNAAIVINPRGMVNHDSLFTRTEKQLEWKSKYGSITVNPAGKNGAAPGAMVGMNEKGLCVLSLWLVNAQYPMNPTNPVVSTELWAKYFLDNAATVSEAIALSQKFDVEPGTLPDSDATKVAQTLGIDRKTLGDINLHLFLQDEQGEAAVFEYLNGKLVVHTGASLPFLVLSNDSYSDSIEYVKQLKAFQGTEDLPSGFDSLSRFAKAAYALKVMPQPESASEAVSHLFVALANAHSLQPMPNTQWTAVFDLSGKIMYLRSIDNQQIRTVRLNTFDLSEGKPILFLSINNDLSGFLEKEFEPLNSGLN